MSGSSYLRDYAGLFSDRYETIYHIEDSDENFEAVKVIIDKRFEEFRSVGKL